MAKFLIDTQLPPLLARYLRNKGHDSKHSTYYRNGHLFNDDQIVKLAISENLIIITKDSDFLDNYILKGAPPSVLLLRLGNISNRQLYNHIEIHFNQVLVEFALESKPGKFIRTHRC